MTEGMRLRVLVASLLIGRDAVRDDVSYGNLFGKAIVPGLSQIV